MRDLEETVVFGGSEIYFEARFVAVFDAKRLST